MWICANCGEKNGALRGKCNKCKTLVSESQAIKLLDDAQNSNQERTIDQFPELATSESFSSSFSRALVWCGGFDLVVGLLGGLFLLRVDVATAIAVAFQGVVVFVFFNVVAEIANTLKAILHNVSDVAESNAAKRQVDD